jgi:hypothetical protein
MAGERRGRCVLLAALNHAATDPRTEKDTAMVFLFFFLQLTLQVPVVKPFAAIIGDYHCAGI